MTKRRSPIVASGYVEAGDVQYDNTRLAKAPLQAWEGERVTVTIAQEVQRRSDRAKGYLFGVVYKEAVQAFKEAGQSWMTKERLHALMKDRHLSELVVDPFTGEERKLIRSTNDLTVAEMSEFMEWVMSDLSGYLGVSFTPPRTSEEWREPAAKA